MTLDIKDANFPVDGDGHTYHLYAKEGHIANRVVTCGDVWRCYIFAKTPGFEIKYMHRAPRGFIIITGVYKGVPISIVSSLMGMANMDFTVRELRYAVKGPMAFMRIGTCGSPAETVVGDVTVPSTFHTVIRVPNAYLHGAKTNTERFMISDAFQPDKQLHDILYKHTVKECGKAFDGAHISTCSFYSSQGRVDKNFKDENETFLDEVVAKIPNLVSIEMETALMCDLSRVAKEKMYVAGAHIILAQRVSQAFLTNDEKHHIEA